MVTNGGGLIFIKPCSGIVSKYKVRAANGVAELLTLKPFYIPLSNFVTRERNFPKKMVVAYATKHPLALEPIGEEVGREVAQCLHILEAFKAYKVGETQEKEAKAEEQPKSAQDWEKSVDLSHVEDEKLRNRIMKILGKYSGM